MSSEGDIRDRLWINVGGKGMSQRDRDFELLNDIMTTMDGPHPPRPDFTAWEVDFVTEMELWLQSDGTVFTARQREKLEEIRDEKC